VSLERDEVPAGIVTFRALADDLRFPSVFVVTYPLPVWRIPRILAIGADVTMRRP